MDGYKIIALSDIVEQLGEDRVTSILSDFWCPKNKDVESFLKTDAYNGLIKLDKRMA